jgi:hypothetical protein
VPVTALGLQAGRATRGHRFQGAARIDIARADDYERLLEDVGGVIASFAGRKAAILEQLEAAAAQHGVTLGAKQDYAALLEEVTALVERPTVYAGAFEQDFLTVPAECLILTMRQNQKYFPLFDAGGKLTHRFLIVSNMRLGDPANIVRGNERVVRPRLADARFFFETDKKTKLAARVPQLASIVHHNKLGSQLQRVERLVELSRRIQEDAAARQGGGRVGGARRPPRQGGPGDAHGGRVPRAAGGDGTLLRRGRWRAALGLPRDRAALLATLRGGTRCPPATPASRWRWPTAWTRSWACSPSATCLPATRTPSACGAPRSGSCAS